MLEGDTSASGEGGDPRVPPSLFEILVIHSGCNYILCCCPSSTPFIWQDDVIIKYSWYSTSGQNTVCG